MKKAKAGFFSRSKDDEDDEEEEPEEIRTAITTATSNLADVVLSVESRSVGSAKRAQKVKVTIVVEQNGKGSIEAVQSGEVVKKEF